MRIYYLDEQEGERDGRGFTAVTIAHINAERIDNFRSSYYASLSHVLNPSKGEKVISTLPGLHGSDLLRDCTDERKICAVSELLKHFTSNGGRFRRVGYFNDSVPYLTDRNARISFCVANAFLRASNASVDKSLWMIAAELDREGLRAGLNSLDQEISQYYQVGDAASWDSVSINFQGLVGHFFALKNDLGCQVADVSGYVAYKAEKTQTGFTEQLGRIFESYKEFYEFNLIIEMSRN